MTNSLQYLVILVTICFILLAQSIRCHRPAIDNNRTQRSSNVLPVSKSYDDDGSSSHSFRLDRNIAIACTNRYNCERTCARAKVAKQATKASLIDALTRTIGESTLTDAHRLGIQFGRHKSCEKCSLVYSNCIDEWYRIARRQLFNWRHDDGPLFVNEDGDNQISSQHKSSNRL